MCLKGISLRNYSKMHNVSKSLTVTTLSHLLHLAGAVLDPLKIDVAVAGPGDALQAVDVVLVNLNAEHDWVSFDMVPFTVGLQGLMDQLLLKPRL